MIKDQKTFRIRGIVIDSQTLLGVQDLKVEAWDKDFFFDDALGTTETDAQGAFEIAFGEDRFQDLVEHAPDLYFKIFLNNDCIASTENSVLWNRKAEDIPVRILVDMTVSADQAAKDYLVKGTVRLADDSAVEEIKVVAFDRDLRSEQLLGQSRTGKQGFYQIRYSEKQLRNAGKGHADLLVKAFAADDSLLAVSQVLFNAPPVAEVDMTIPAGILLPPTLFEKIGQALEPLLEGLPVEELEEDKSTHDLSFLSGETGIEKAALARYALAHRLALQAIRAEFWFVLLGGSFYQFTENQSLKEQLAIVLDKLPSLDDTAVHKAFVRGFKQKEIPETFRDSVACWTEAFMKFAAGRSVQGDAKPGFVKLALEDAHITDPQKQETFARLFNTHKALTPELLDALGKDTAFKPEEIAGLNTSFELADLTRGDFSVVKMVKDAFSVRQPAQIRALAKRSEAEWVKLVQDSHAAGTISLPFGAEAIAGEIKLPEAEIYGKMLERRFREAFPTAAFTGGLERALGNGGARGIHQAEALGQFLDLHPDFELLNTPIDDFLNNDVQAQFQDEAFRLEIKAVQRVFKIAPSFEATDALLADGLHSAQKIYRQGQSEFVRRYEKQPGFTRETAKLAWNRAADTHAAVLTIIGDLAEFDSGILPGVLKSSHPDLKKFPNWENLFQSGDICHCEDCRSVLSPAAYFAELLMFLKDRKKTDGSYSAKDVLLNRRPDLGFLELNCANALTPLPYIDVVCEVLEQAVDENGGNDLELPDFTAMPAGDAAKAAVGVAFAAQNINLGADFSLSQVDDEDPDRWVVHGDDATYLLKKKAPSPDFFAEILRNTKAGADELRAYPHYINPKTYEKLRAAKYPLALPFDLFGEEVKAAFQKTNLQRWDLMRSLRGIAAPNNPTDSDIAAGYFGISGSADPAGPSEKNLILVADPTPDGQQAVWGEVGDSWLDAVAGVKTFLGKTGLEYNELLALLDLKFINPAGNISVYHLDTSCDTRQKTIQVLDAAKLDCIHRFLRLWRKLKGWKLWELDLVIDRIGGGVLDEAFLVQLFYFGQLRTRLGPMATVEQTCALFGGLNTGSRFTQLHEKREDALYQSLFLNKRLVHPLDPVFELDPANHEIWPIIDPVTGRPIIDTMTGLPKRRKLSNHHPVVLAALGIREADLVLLKELEKAGGARYINDDLTLDNLSFLWRHAWLSKLLKFKVEEWRTILKIFQQDILRFPDPEAAWKFVERVDQFKASGFTPDELNWLLAADRSAKTAVKETGATRFLAALRKDLQAIQAEYDPNSPQYDFLFPPRNQENLTALLNSLLQRLSRGEAEINIFLKTLRGPVLLEADVHGLPSGFNFPASVTGAPNNIPIRSEWVLRFTGSMTEAQRTTLLTDPSLAAVTVLSSYQQAIQDLFEQSGQATVTGLPADFVFPASITGEPNNIAIRYEPVLRFNGVMTIAQQTLLLNDASLALVTDNIAFVNAIAALFQQSQAAGDNFVSVEVDALLPTGVILPSDLPSLPIRYNSTTNKLGFIGLMSEAERLALIAAGNPAGTIDELFRRPRLLVKFYEPTFTAPLEAFPPSVDFKTQLPAGLAAKITYDAEQRVLRFAGIMGTEEQTALNALAPPAEAAYHIAVDSLATQPQTMVLPDDRIWVTDDDLDPTLPANNTVAKRSANAARKALLHLSKMLAANAVVQQCSVQLGLSEALTRHLLTKYPLLPESLMVHLTGAFAATTGVIDYATFKTTFDGWFWASRVATLLNKWKITLAELETITDLTAGAQLLDLLTLPLDTTGAIASIDPFIRTCRLLRLRDSLPETGITLLEVLEKLAASVYPSAADFAADVALLNEAWLAADVETLVTSLDLAFPDDYLLAESWERLRRAFYFLDNLNARAGTALAFAAPAMDDTHAKAMKELLRSKFGTETWLTLSAGIQDVLRERKRDALAAYLLTQPQPADAPSGKWENTNDLYAYYLLDVEMSSCQLTSRLVQGSGSIQLFVQRCFMGLEPDVTVNADGDNGDSAWRWWTWMRKYRVWEANRKVFLWPENWIEPELKKDRSPFFKDLENELLQNEINQYSVETAFSNYLEKLDSVAQLEIAGFYQEDDGDDTILHVFGRTTGAEPHLYYYRRFDYRQWTAWEKVDLDIQGDYLIPAVVNKRLFLFWPVFTEVPDEAENSKNVPIPDSTDGDAPLKKAFKKLRLQMAVSDYRQGKWSPKRISTDFDQSEIYKVELEKQHYVFLPIDRSEIDGRFAIKYKGIGIGSDGDSHAELYGAFEITSCKGVPERTNIPGYFDHVIRPETDSTGYEPVFMKWAELGAYSDRLDAPQEDFTLQNRYASQFDYFKLTSVPLNKTSVLMNTPWLFKMTPPWHLSYFDKAYVDGLVGLGQDDSDGFYAPVGSWLPFFYNDNRRTFFVLPSLSWSNRKNKIADIAGSDRYYYPDIKKFFRRFEGQVQTWLDTFPLPVQGSKIRRQVEQFLSAAFPEEAAPPYDDEQLKALGKRWYMRFVHYYMGVWSLYLFQSRQFQSRQFHFKNHYHPFVCDFAKLLYNPLKGIPALMSRETQLKDSGFSFEKLYQPTEAVVKLPPLLDGYPREDVDFTPDGAYSPYNWELFFHAPLLIANSLSKNQRFEEAREWYHFIFNPIGVESTMPGGSPTSKYWITKPFFETTNTHYVAQRIDNILRMLSEERSGPGGPLTELEKQVDDWRANPFEPHRIANYRTVAYQKTVVMKYLDNLINWGDYLFRQDSMESVNEATQLYVMAAEILGPRPKKIPSQAKPSLESFNELETQFDRFSNTLVQLENLVPVMPGSGPDGADHAQLPMLYFCIPQNDKMLGYWDTVADRLYKIRHCMNIEGVARQLALFEPPIDPAALVKAAAGGVDISSALADLNAPLPLYRFYVLLQKANEICNDVKALGSALLSALEKKDAEALSLLRQGQEIRLLEAVKTLKDQQIEEAKENLEGVTRAKATVEERRNYYRDIEKRIAQEQLQLDKLGESHSLQEAAQGVKLAASIISILPAIDLGVSGFGGSPLAKFKIGGLELGQAASLASDVLSFLSQIASNDAAMASSKAIFDRREDDWKFQERIADKELLQIDKQIAAAELRIAIAEKERENHLIQIENAKATDDFMRTKYTNQELYQWQMGQVSGVYFQSYKLAYDLAKRAERCFRFELGLLDSSYIQFGYWDSLKNGLLSGEKLQYDLRRLETAYLEQNRREFELTKHVSLLLLDPLALVKLRETGRCFMNLPEEIFDLDFPGHYFRRIKSVSITLPCVAGPYTTISCTLRLLKSRVRINTGNGDIGYPHNTDDLGLPADDGRFIENTIPVKAIAASSGQNDSGVFELNFRDERYLPFEGAGAISEWSLELFSDLPSNNPDPGNPDFGKPLRQFDYGTLSDAILHVKYTAREDAVAFKNGAVAHLRDYWSQEGATPSLRLFNLRQEFPTQWHRFLNPATPANGNIFELEMSPSLFRFLDTEKGLKVNTIWLMAHCANTSNYSVELMLIPPLPAPPIGPETFTLVRVNQYGGLHFSQKDVTASGIEIVPADPPNKWQLKITRPEGGNLQADEVKDLILVLGYEWE